MLPLGVCHVRVRPAYARFTLARKLQYGTICLFGTTVNEFARGRLGSVPLRWGINFHPRFGSCAEWQALNRVPFFNPQCKGATTWREGLKKS